jgi:hypothetical protein
MDLAIHRRVNCVYPSPIPSDSCRASAQVGLEGEEHRSDLLLFRRILRQSPNVLVNRWRVTKCIGDFKGNSVHALFSCPFLRMCFSCLPWVQISSSLFSSCPFEGLKVQGEIQATVRSRGMVRDHRQTLFPFPGGYGDHVSGIMYAAIPTRCRRIRPDDRHSREGRALVCWIEVMMTRDTEKKPGRR